MGDDGMDRNDYSRTPKPRHIPREVMTPRRRSLLGMWRKLGKTASEISRLIDERIAHPTRIW